MNAKLKNIGAWALAIVIAWLVVAIVLGDIAAQLFGLIITVALAAFLKSLAASAHERLRRGH